MKDEKILSSFIAEKNIPNNHLAILSGLQPQHVKAFRTGHYKNNSRSVLIRLCLALELTFSEINKVLAEQNKDPLGQFDISHFIEAIQKRKFPSGIHRLKPGHIHFDIQIISLEKAEGDVQLVTGYPHGVFVDHDLEKKPFDDVYKCITKDLAIYRKDVFKSTMKKNSIKHLICEGCLKEYMTTQKDKKELKRTLKDMFKALDYDNYTLALIDECPHFYFHLKSEQGKDRSEVLFAGKNSNHGKNNVIDDQGRSQEIPLFGFQSNRKELFEQFKIEFERLSKAQIQETTTKQGLYDYIGKMLQDEGIDFGEAKN